MKKRWMAFLLLVAMIFAGSLTQTVLADKVNVNMDSKVIKAGEEITVTISLEEAIAASKGVTMLQGELVYEKDSLTYKSSSTGVDYKGLTCVNSKNGSVFKFNWNSDTSTATGFQAGQMVKVIYTAKKDISVDDIGSKVGLELIMQDASGKDVSASATIIICKDHKWDVGTVVTKATCAKDGAKTYTCACGETKTEVIKATGAHTWGTAVMAAAATMDEDGYYVKTCAGCGASEKTGVIAKIASATLSATSYTYNKKARKPSVVVKDSAGKTLKNGTDYSVTYAKGRKNVGKYDVTVTFTGKYMGTEKLTFSIVPKSTKLFRVTVGKKKLTVRWKKQASQTNGYQIQYSLKKNFFGAKTKLVKKNKTTSLTISKLKSNKTYYVRVRTYKEVKVNGKKTKIYSSWSSKKKIKVK